MIEARSQAEAAGMRAKFEAEASGKEKLGLADVNVLNNTASSGDWVFGVPRDGVWLHAFQSNRYPCHGFSYSVNLRRRFPTLDAAASQS